MINNEGKPAAPWTLADGLLAESLDDWNRLGRPSAPQPAPYPPRSAVEAREQTERSRTEYGSRHSEEREAFLERRRVKQRETRAEAGRLRDAVPIEVLLAGDVDAVLAYATAHRIPTPHRRAVALAIRRAQYIATKENDAA